MNTTQRTTALEGKIKQTFSNLTTRKEGSFHFESFRSEITALLGVITLKNVGLLTTVESTSKHSLKETRDLMQTLIDEHKNLLERVKE